MKYIIDMKLPSLNDYIKVCRSNKFQAAKYKKDIEDKIGLFLIKMPKYNKPIKFIYYET